MTKSRGSGHGGRREGAGRPRFMKTGKAAYFSTRITEETRELLEIEARRSGQSLSAAVERLLRLGLEENERRKQDAPLRAIYYLMGLLALRIPGPGLAADPKYNWRTNPFMFEAFIEAVSNLLCALRPSGQMIAPPHVPLPDPPADAAARKRAELVHELHFPKFDTPENRGRDVAGSTLLEILHNSRMEKDVFDKLLDSDDGLYGGKDAAVRTHYRLVDAGRDLGFSPGGTPTLIAFNDLDEVMPRRVKPDTDDEGSKK